MSERTSWALDLFLIAAIAAAMIWPIFKTKCYDNWMAIDSTFIADGRYLSENLPHPGWQPLWYGGTRFDYVYPPALRYGTAIIAKATGFVPGKAYHIYTGLFYSLGIAFIYLLVRAGSSSRLYGWAAALAAAISPALLFMVHIRADVYPFFSERLSLLVRSGEGPHMPAFATLPMAITLAWHGLHAGYVLWLAVSAAAAVAVIYLAATWFLARRGANPWTIFVLGLVTICFLNTLGQNHSNFRIAGESERLIPEFDLALILLCGLGLPTLWRRFPARVPRTAVAAIALAAVLVPGKYYLEKPWRHLNRTCEGMYLREYQIANRVATYRSDTRSHVTGTVRGWWNAWTTSARIGGGSWEGSTKLRIMDMFWPKASGDENPVVKDKTAKLRLSDFEHPLKCKRALPVLWEDNESSWIYDVPRKDRSLARVVDAASDAKSQSSTWPDDIEALQLYVDTHENATTPTAQIRWLKPDTLAVAAETATGQFLAVQVAFDPSWRARENGIECNVAEDVYGQIRIDLPPGQFKRVLHFETTLKNQAGRAVSLLAFFFAAFLLTRKHS